MNELPVGFVVRIRELVPSSPELETGLTKGSLTIIGKCIAESIRGSFSDQDIIAAVDGWQLYFLIAEARKNLRRRQLYLEWCKIWESQ